MPIITIIPSTTYLPIPNTFGKHNVSATLLYGAIERKYNSTYTRATGFDRLNSGYNNLSLGTTITDTSDAWTERLNYQMARVNYKFNDKYLYHCHFQTGWFFWICRELQKRLLPYSSRGLDHFFGRLYERRQLCKLS